MTAPEAKLLPLRVSVKAGPPAVAESGLNDVMAGGGLMVNETPLEIAPPDITVTVAAPWPAMSDAGIEAVSWVALTNVVLRAAEFHWTTELDENPLPFTVKVNAGPPAGAEVGLIEVVKGGGSIVNDTPLDVTPPDTTVTVGLPWPVMKLPVTTAVSLVALTKVVVRAELFHWTTAPDAKPLPLTVRVNAGPPAVAELGLSDAMTGGGLMVNDAPLEVAPPDVTVIAALSWLAMRAAGTAAVS
jgi:hypothetical protein